MTIKTLYPNVRPTLDLAFAATKALDPRITFTRASTGTYVGSDGTLRTAGINEARFDHSPLTLESLGLLVEEARTNSIRNNTGVGAVAGTPGTLPTNWSISGGGIGTLTQEVVAIGTSNGITYVDVKYSGTSSSTGFRIFHETVGQIAASTGQAWTGSVYAAILPGSTGLTSVNVAINERNSANSIVNIQSGTSYSTLSSTMTRLTATIASASATTVSVQPELNIVFPNTTAVNFTLRIGLPQLELGAFATSVIPTTTAAATRSADVASITGTAFSSWYRQDEGTFYADVINTAVPIGGAARRVFEVNNNSEAERLFAGFNSTTLAQMLSQDNNVVQVNLVQTVPAPISNVKLSAAYRLNDTVFTANGSTVASNAACTIPTPTQLTIGSSTSGGNSTLNSTIRRLTYWPWRLSNATLQALTS